MSARWLGLGALLTVVLLAFLVTRGSGEDTGYAFNLELDNALGLRPGTLVTEGGVEIGKVQDVDFTATDKVRVKAVLEDGRGPIGKDARAFITSVNLLGQKRLELAKGTLSEPAPSGTLLAASRVTPSTDLDEVLAVLAPDTRARLNVLINEAGAAVVGRGPDAARLIRTLPSTMAKATELVDAVAGDNHTLADLVTSSDRLVAQVTRERRSLSGLIDSAGQAAGTVATKRAELRATLAQAPGMLNALRRFLGELESTTVPLGPAARDLTAVAPELRATLAELEPFRDAAGPTLQAATAAAPDLTRLATGATPVLRAATPTVRRLADFSSDVLPLTKALDRSVDNLIATVDNWSRAVQYRDGLSHIFRGEAGMTPQTLESLINGLVPAKKKSANRTPKQPPKPASVVPQHDKPILPKPALPKLPGLPAVDKALDEVLGNDAATPLLDFLLKP